MIINPREKENEEEGRYLFVYWSNRFPCATIFNQRTSIIPVPCAIEINHLAFFFLQKFAVLASSLLVGTRAHIIKSSSLHVQFCCGSSCTRETALFRSLGIPASPGYFLRDSRRFPRVSIFSRNFVWFHPCWKGNGGNATAVRIRPNVISISCLRTRVGLHISDMVGGPTVASTRRVHSPPRCIFHGDVGKGWETMEAPRPLNYPPLTDGRRRPAGLIGVGRVRASRFRGRANIL